MSMIGVRLIIVVKAAVQSNVKIANLDRISAGKSVRMLTRVGSIFSTPIYYLNSVGISDGTI